MEIDKKVFSTYKRKLEVPWATKRHRLDSLLMVDRPIHTRLRSGTKFDNRTCSIHQRAIRERGRTADRKIWARKICRGRT